MSERNTEVYARSGILGYRLRAFQILIDPGNNL